MGVAPLDDEGSFCRKNAAIIGSVTRIVRDGSDENCDGVDGTDADRDGLLSMDSGGLDCNDNRAPISRR